MASSSNSGTIEKAAMREKDYSRQSHRGPQNPNRQRQPKRVGNAAGQVQTAMVSRSIKGSDLGQG